jgi:hypothetical protein
MTHSEMHSELLATLKQQFTEEEWGYILEQKEQLVRRYRAAYGRTLPVEQRANATVTEALQGRNLTVMYGGGKDSGVMLAGARAMQLLIEQEYGITLELRVGIGEHSGMVGGVYENIDKALDVLKLKDDPSVDVAWLQRDRTQHYQTPPTTLPATVKNLSRQAIVQNGHMFSGAGRRTFCDSCNLGLGQWISSMLAYKGGADVFMTGDNVTETSAQIDGAVKEMAQDLNIALPNSQKRTPTQQNFANLASLEATHHAYLYGLDDLQGRMRFKYQDVPEKTQFMGFFGKDGVSNTIGKRVEFLHDFLGMDYSTLAFSFTESDCGNPALMAHIYGLIAQHAYGDKGATYADGIRMVLDYVMPKVVEKEFPPEFIEELKERYKDDKTIAQTRRNVEEYALKAYDLKPEHLVAMVYSPFAGQGTNLKCYLDYVRSIEPSTESSQLVGNSERQIERILQGHTTANEQQKLLVNALEELTGVPLEQMRSLYTKDLLINNFDLNHRASEYGDVMRQTLDKDWLYIGTGTLKHDGQTIAQLTIRAR